MTFVLVCVCGGLGAGARFVTDGVIRARWRTAFPWATFTINVLGSFVIGVVMGAVIHHDAPEAWHLYAATGFCGGFTTFSTAMVETVRLAQSDRGRLALANALGTTVAAVAAAALGIALAAAL
ncbi:camphor resistance protein CrcB [Sediminihabitans luteus]|uniref:Fluoride-specific ion channel FluC n=1 Tax=Sediminihabitans luteus TaxID=1138585 RepID=A0A2M9D0V9_9CELL|nr:fluoride efflux transporter CrcB [Sediminihabitans luteus]PJJ77800.1 camphor resistance protein CrcB [Sediminihabitans luteus]GII99842.1 putative fluoride ion transporter CrcB [Sediminihabitans luteus]